MGPEHATARDLQTATLEAHGRTVVIECDPTDHIGRKLAAGRWYERDLLEDARQRAKPGSVVDIGAHIGNHTLWFGAVCERRVVAMEPSEDSYELLHGNVVRNAINCWLIKAAAGAVGGAGRIDSVVTGNSGMTTVVDDPSGSVQIIAIDSLDLLDVAVLKVDVEGSELGVLQGASETIVRCRPLVYVEAATDESQQEVDRHLKALGYGGFGRFGKTPTWGYA